MVYFVWRFLKTDCYCAWKFLPLVSEVFQKNVQTMLHRSPVRFYSTWRRFADSACKQVKIYTKMQYGNRQGEAMGTSYFNEEEQGKKLRELVTELKMSGEGPLNCHQGCTCCLN